LNIRFAAHFTDPLFVYDPYAGFVTAEYSCREINFIVVLRLVAFRVQ
jgi:hypothetical protein